MTVTKKKGKYYSRFQINGERHHYLCNGATSVKEAEKMESAFKYKLMQQQHGVIPREEKKVPMKKLYDNYWNYALANNTDLKHVKSKIKYFKLYFGELKDANKLTPSDMETYKKYLIDSGKKPATINKYRSSLLKMFNLAIEDDLIDKNPCRKWKKMVEDEVKPKYWTKQEEQKFKRYCPEWLKDLIILALATGLRKSNVRLFKKSWIDFSEKQIKIPRTQNKGKKYIILPFTKELEELFLKYMDTETELLFINTERKTPFSENRIDKAFAETCEKAQIKNIGFHGLRHTVGTRLGEAGVDLAVIQDWLAHTSIATTKRYRHTTKEEFKKAMLILNSYS